MDWAKPVPMTSCPPSQPRQAHAVRVCVKLPNVGCVCKATATTLVALQTNDLGQVTACGLTFSLLRYCARPLFMKDCLRKKGATLIYRCAMQRSEPKGDQRNAKADQLHLAPLVLIARLLPGVCRKVAGKSAKNRSRALYSRFMDRPLTATSQAPQPPAPAS